MGIRIKKYLGYGLNLQTVNLDVCSTNLTHMNKVMYSEKVFKKFQDDVKNHVKNDAQYDVWDKYCYHKFTDTIKIPSQFIDMVKYDDEFRDKNHIQFIPATQEKQWYHYDDDLDYQEWFLNHKEIGHEIKWTKGALYPFLNLMRKNKDSILGIEKYWESCYLDNPKYKDAIPYAPTHLYFLIKHLKIVPEDKVLDTFMSLRPCIYTYWS